MNHDDNPDESKTRTERLSKLPYDGDPWAPNNLLTPEQKKNTSWTPVGQATDKKLRSQPTKMNSFKHTYTYAQNVEVSFEPVNSHQSMADAIKVKRSIYFATLQGYVIFETEL